MGETEMTAEDFMELLNAEQENFTAQKYDLFNNNCNHFSNFCCEMLVGKEIGKEYLHQAEEFKGTPIYNMLKGMQVNPTNNNNNYNISYQGFQQSNNMQSKFYTLQPSSKPCRLFQSNSTNQFWGIHT